MNTSYSPTQLGWQAFFQQQLTLTELESSNLGRVIAHHRSNYLIQLQSRQISLATHISLPSMTVGDWVLLDENYQFIRLLSRKSVISRKAAGSKVAEQLIAANIDSLFIVCSLNQDFNLNRIERYLALANEAQVEPIVVLTKKDLVDGWQQQVQLVQELDPFLTVEAINALEPSSVECLKAWCSTGKTLSFVGSSGVGKSSLVNTLLGCKEQLTGSIREDDAKGRHTTTARSLHFMDNGSVLLDTPGMREIQLADCQQGISKTFAEIEALESACRFSDCSHQNEPGCAVQQAIESGELEVRRFNNFIKLRSEHQRNNVSLKDKRDKERALAKKYRFVQSDTRRLKKGY
ncbi:ribosome small subunit-dependent GTPase A [Pseudoalteromonas sp. BMB]|uniref:ribosome small subunit-dependent GTPase A n=1 Tax=Pseudoalteromonas sp. BMB TaxID=1874619 RepID=UPI00083D2972|nr:ribosome small subunit-dependent GTPase A [Pseudoalteromonas sp. BMB]ODB38592.1 ribosome small subunit-dependent GTPase A [Pseudoalteromonas sp. BMB]